MDYLCMKTSNSSEIVVPATVYRLQLSAEFTIKKAIKILPYLKELGIEAVYCSPYFQAYSAHGYDITDPNMFNTKLGTAEEFAMFYQSLKKWGLLHIVDVVPNHMGYKGGENRWWQDVLENGPFSDYAQFFDINWSPEKRELQDKVLLPILDKPYGNALANHDLTLAYKEDHFFIQYADYPLPVAPHTYAMILGTSIEDLKSSFPENDSDLQEYIELIELYRLFPIASQERKNKRVEGRARLVTLLKRSPKLRAHVKHLVNLFNGKHNHHLSFDLLNQLLEGQFYRVSYWRVAGHEINYRRFFNFSELVSIKIEENTVLEEHHALLFKLIEAGHVQGIRIDHPDGLYDPILYFQRLRQHFTLYTVAEKILERKEKLPQEWEVEGTVGYEYLNVLSGIFIARQNEEAITKLYEDFVGNVPDFDESLYRAKKYFTDYEMANDVGTLGLRLDRLSENSPEYRDFTRQDLTAALSEVIACFPVYRSYIRLEGGVSKRDAHFIKVAIDKAKSRAHDLDSSIFDFLEKLLLVKLKRRRKGEEFYRELVLSFQQLTAPVMAKGLEDTVCYDYNRFISLNEVGGDPRHFGNSVGEFHAQNQEKQVLWPYGFLATSSHDTKRSEDVRMRLNVLSEIPDRWVLEVKKWELINNKHKKGAPSLNTEYFIYQTLLGIWPRNPVGRGQHAQICDRIWQMILKSIREAKQETSWRAPNTEYEEATRDFLFAILSTRKTNRFMPLFTEFLTLIDRYGAWNSLSQVVLKGGSPGVYEIYQGNELLTYRLVDPDNRTPVDFDACKKELHALRKFSIEELFAKHELSKVKMALQTKLLHHRLEQKALYLDGEYIQLSVKGLRKENIVAYMRHYEDAWAIVLASRFFTQLASAAWDVPLGQHAWGNTEVMLPPGWKYPMLTDIFTGRLVRTKTRANTLRLAEVFEHLPVSVLVVHSS